MQIPLQNTIDKVQYISYQNLSKPQMKQISDSIIELGFLSDQWVIQFQTITKLRQANKHYSMIFFNQLLIKFSKRILGQVQNLRSNNSKQALTLLTQIFKYQNLSLLTSQIIRPIISILFIKSTSEKGFIKSQALKAINLIPNIFNPYILQQLQSLTKSANGIISQLSIKIMNQMLQQNSITEFNQKFLKDLSKNINGKRAIVQKQAKQIFNNIKKRIGENKLEQIIDNSNQLDQEESNTLKRQLKTNNQGNKSKNQDFKQFMMKQKKQGQSQSSSTTTANIQ